MGLFTKKKPPKVEVVGAVEKKHMTAEELVAELKDTVDKYNELMKTARDNRITVGIRTSKQDIRGYGCVYNVTLDSTHSLKITSIKKTEVFLDE